MKVEHGPPWMTMKSESQTGGAIHQTMMIPGTKPCKVDTPFGSLSVVNQGGWVL